MKFSKSVWDQLKNITVDDLVSAHFHPHKTYGPKLLKSMLDDIGWTESDLKRLKVVR